MVMQRNTLKRATASVFVTKRVKSKRRTKPLILSAWTAATTVYFGECLLVKAFSLNIRDCKY